MRGIAKAVADATGARLAINPTHTAFLSSSQRQTVKPGAHDVQVGPGKVNDFFCRSYPYLLASFCREMQIST